MAKKRMRKSFIFIIFILIVSVGIAIFYTKPFSRETEITATTTTISAEDNSLKPSPSVKIESDDELIKAALVEKNSWNPDDITVAISKNDGQYAKGSVNTDSGGGMWFAAKVNGVWKIVFDGNGIITCESLTNYKDFPIDLIPECYDESTSKLIKRL